MHTQPLGDLLEPLGQAERAQLRHRPEAAEHLDADGQEPTRGESGRRGRRPARVAGPTRARQARRTFDEHRPAGPSGAASQRAPGQSGTGEGRTARPTSAARQSGARDARAAPL
jgi:hypothetical protein